MFTYYIEYLRPLCQREIKGFCESRIKTLLSYRHDP